MPSKSSKIVREEPKCFFLMLFCRNCEQVSAISNTKQKLKISTAQVVHWKCSSLLAQNLKLLNFANCISGMQNIHTSEFKRSLDTLLHRFCLVDFVLLDHIFLSFYYVWDCEDAWLHGTKETRSHLHVQLPISQINWLPIRWVFVCHFLWTDLKNPYSNSVYS